MQLSQTGDPRWQPSLDVHAEGDYLVVHADLPGMNLDELDLTVDHGELVLHGAHWEGAGAHPGHVQGVVDSRLPLPFALDPGTVDATFEDDVLEVRIPLP
jgi:HSP20 family protein